MGELGSTVHFSEKHNGDDTCQHFEVLKATIAALPPGLPAPLRSTMQPLCMYACVLVLTSPWARRKWKNIGLTPLPRNICAVNWTLATSIFDFKSYITHPGGELFSLTWHSRSQSSASKRKIKEACSRAFCFRHWNARYNMFKENALSETTYACSICRQYEARY